MRKSELTEFFSELTEFGAEFSEFSLLKQYSPNSNPRVTHYSSSSSPSDFLCADSPIPPPFLLLCVFFLQVAALATSLVASP